MSAPPRIYRRFALITGLSLITMAAAMLCAQVPPSIDTKSGIVYAQSVNGPHKADAYIPSGTRPSMFLLKP